MRWRALAESASQAPMAFTFECLSKSSNTYGELYCITRFEAASARPRYLESGDASPQSRALT